MKRKIERRSNFRGVEYTDMLVALRKTGIFQKKSVWISLLIVVDALSAFLAFLTAISLRLQFLVKENLGSIEITHHYNDAFVMSLFFLIVTYALNELYDFKNLKRMNEIVLLSRAHIKWVVFVMALAYLYQYDFSRFILFVFVVSAFIYSLVGRSLVRFFRNLLLLGGVGLQKVIIVGHGKIAKDVEKSLQDYYSKGFSLVCSLSPENNNGIMCIPKDDLVAVVRQHPSAVVYIADPRLSYEHILEIVSVFDGSTTQFKIVADIFALATGSFNVTDVDEIPTLDLSKVVPSSLYRVVKRLVDTVVSFVLLILLMPLLFIIALLIKIDSSGSALIAQTRVGHKGKTFRMWKFRTMFENVELYEKSPRDKKDGRITRFGTLLRKTSLDELPQLINVLKGDMSLVGPRPEMLFIVEKYTLWQRKRLEVKPGITGLWQILGRKDLPLSENLQYDFYYINNQSLLLDFVILLKTIPAVVFGRGAY